MQGNARPARPEALARKRWRLFGRRGGAGARARAYALHERGLEARAGRGHAQLRQVGAQQLHDQVRAALVRALVALARQADHVRARLQPPQRLRAGAPPLGASPVPCRCAVQRTVLSRPASVAAFKRHGGAQASMSPALTAR